MKNFLIVIILAGVGIYQWAEQKSLPVFPASKSPSIKDSSVIPNDQTLSNAIKNKRSNIQVKGLGHVLRLLPDDNKGSRHQKFILRLPSGESILIAHNIDLAPRINSLSKGDPVQFYGEYEWSQKGGVVHWTHKDPGNRHIHGWLKHNNETYQ